MAELIFPLSFKRQYGGSLDPDLVFETIVDRDTYLTNPLRYAGQIVACKELEGKIFVLNNAMDKWLSQESADSCKVKISNDDITEDFLENKIVGTTDKISITKQNTGENETLIINVSTDVFDKTVDNTENITETENKVFVSPTEKTAWNNKLSSIPSEYITETELSSALSLYALITSIPDVSNKLEATNLIQGTNVTLAKDGNNVTISATGGGTSAVYTGATDLLDGAEGLVVKPLIADKDKYLKGDGTWSVITGTGTSDYNSLNNKPTSFIGATAETNGVMGFVPVPTTTDINKYLSSNGGWETISIPTVDTVLNELSNNAISNSAVTAAFNALTSGVQDYIGYFGTLALRDSYSGTISNGDWCTVAVDSDYENATTNYIYNSTIPDWVYNGTVSTTQVSIDDNAIAGDNDVVFSADKVLTLLDTKPNMSIIVEASTSISWILSEDTTYYYQSIAVTGVTTDNTVTVSLSPNHTKVQYLTCSNAMLQGTAQAENAITIACYGTKPTISIPLVFKIEQVVSV